VLCCVELRGNQALNRRDGAWLGEGFDLTQRHERLFDLLCTAGGLLGSCEGRVLEAVHVDGATLFVA
jgi:hypothetical protein